tara:strand:+ start:94 stop:213 length:120 start_codon:yes stop_codon:yes gene_type:complete
MPSIKIIWVTQKNIEEDEKEEVLGDEIKEEIRKNNSLLF